MIKDLTKTTFIIPIKLEHVDRLRNANVVLKFLEKHIKTNVFIFEIGEEGKVGLPFVNEFKNLSIKYWVGSQKDFFHRTRYLNIMLDEVETPVVVNYDIDVILDPKNMEECQQRILDGMADVIYPYELGLGQIQILEQFNYEGFEKSGFDLDFIHNSNQTNKHQAECGHSIFFNTETYRKLGGENENFISYGPEDKERMYRFQKLGKKVEWREGCSVYHFEHFRGNDSWVTNPYFQPNWKVFDSIKSLDEAGLSSYYVDQHYFSQYKKIGNLK